MSVTIQSMLGLLNLGGGEIILILAILILPLALVGVGVIIWLIALAGTKKQPLIPANPPAATPASMASSTQVIPRKCPKCGADLKVDAPEGLCPACLLQRGLATEGGAPPGTASFTPPPLAELAKLFPQLEILEMIGQGGMGAVYKARQPALDRFVALKILAPRSGGDLDFSGRFSREARALARLSHPNIVAVYDFGQIATSASPSPTPDPRPLSYFIMEYVDGPNLRQVEQAGKLTPREALQIIPQICVALQFAHDEGIVHRDIKPENVLLDKKGRVKIADFGLAKILGQEADLRLTGARDVMGTPHYMAPEQVETPQEVDHRADIYSLGVVFYEMLTGELPLGKFDPPSHKVQIDVRLDDVVMRSLSKSPDRRYQHVSEVRTEVETIAQNPPTSGAQPNPSASTGTAAGCDYPLNIRHCLSRGWNLMKKNFWPMVAVYALVTILLVFMGSFSLRLSTRWGLNFGSALSVIFSGVLLGGLHLFFLKLIRGERATLETVFSGFRNCFLQLFLGSLVGTFLVALGFLCFVLPGVYLLIAWLFTLVLIIDKRLDFWPAMELSRKVITRHWWKFLGFAIILFLMKLTGILFCFIGFFIAGPIVHAAFLYAYEDIFGAGPEAGARAGANPPLAPRSGSSSGSGWGIAIGAGAVVVFIAFLGLAAAIAIPNFIKARHRAQAYRAQQYQAQQMHRQMAQRQAGEQLANGTNISINSVNGHLRSTVIEGFANPASRLIFSIGGQDVWSSGFPENTHFTARLERADRGLRLQIADSRNNSLLDETARDELGPANFNDGDIHFVEGEFHPGPDDGLDDAGSFTLGYFQPENGPALPIGVRLVSAKIEAIIHIRNFFAFAGSANVEYSAKIPLGYTLQATANTGMAHSFAIGTQYHALWNGGGPRPPRPLGPGDLPPVSPPKMDSPDQMRAQGAVMEAQLQELEDQGPIPVVLGEPKRMFSVTNGSGDIWQGFLELVASGTNEPAAVLPTPIPPLEAGQPVRILPAQGLPAPEQPGDESPPFAGQPPVVVETFPVSGARDVAPGEMEIQVRFSKGMAHGSWSWTSAWKDSTPESLAEPHYLDDGRTCVLKVRLEPGKTYAWWLNSDEFKNFKDTAGLPAVPYLLIFQTKPN